MKVITIALAASAAAKVITYDFNLTYVMTNPDGLSNRKTIGINNQWPPPVMEASKGDTVIVNVINSLEKSATFHFHGIYQNGTNEMDGASMVTQCPIPPGGSMVYTIPINEVGTQWYHCHVDYCYPNGYRQAFIVHDNEAPFANQAQDELLLTVSDWYHTPVDDLETEFMCLYNPTGAEPIPDSFLFNDAVNQSVYVQPNTTYYVHIINVGGFVGQYFYIEGHNFSIVEVDGIYTEPTEAGLLYIAPGQRYGLLLTTRDTAEANYAIMTVADSQMLDTLPANVALNLTNWLVYNNDSMLPAGDLSGVASSQDLHPFDDLDLVPYDRMSLLPEPDVTVNLTLNFINLKDGINYGVFNDRTYTAPKVPTLYTALGAGNLSSDAAVYGDFTLPVVLQHNQIVEIIMNNADTGTHPLYLHGHNFQIVGRAPAYGAAYYDYLDGDPVSYDPARDRSSFHDFPVRRDVAVLPPQGWFVLRFVADNPGVWIFHCQVDWHLGAGLGMIFIEAPELISDAIGSIPADHLAVCAAAGVPSSGNAAGNTENYLNLDGQNAPPGYIPDGFTPRGEAAMAFSVLSALLGIVALVFYGLADLKNVPSGPMPKESGTRTLV